MKDEKPERVVAVGAVVLSEDGRVLLVKRAHPPKAGTWTLPGGRVEPLESLEAAIVREVREETSLVVEARSSLGIVHLSSEGFDYDIHEFLCEAPSPAQPVAGDDAADVRWAESSELAALGVTQEVARLVRRAKRRHAG